MAIEIVWTKRADKKFDNILIYLSKEWGEVLRKAALADEIDGGQYSLINVWVTASYAIQDAIYRKECKKVIKATDRHFHFFDSKARERYNSLENGKEHKQILANVY